MKREVRYYAKLEDWDNVNALRAALIELVWGMHHVRLDALVSAALSLSRLIVSRL
jgi:hypothetical protein